MHESVIAFLSRTISPSEIEGRRVLEVGSQDVNGTPRPMVLSLKPREYVGCDLSAGPGVDRVLDACDLVRTFGPESFDVVICTEMLEHAQNWKGVISQTKAVLKESGLVVLTTRGPGFKYHPHPGDWWRFTVNDMARIFADMELLIVEADPQAPGVFVKARKPAQFREADLEAIAVLSMHAPRT